jgi:3-oxoacyl-[acyl-carrier-protein] synthase II
MSEGAGCLVIENLESVINRNAESKIYAEILGCGLNADVNHITNPSPDGDGAYRLLSLCIFIYKETTRVSKDIVCAF